jgi:sucrose-phosphate synthase
LDEAVEDKRWQQFISFRWNRETIENTLEGFPGISMQEVESQHPHKLSYYVERDQFDHDALMTLLQPLISRLNIIFSRDSFLDIMPKRSSKGRAVRYLSQKWSIPLKNTIVCGDSGNDLDMFEGSARGIVVANHAKELEELTLRRNNYFAKEESAAGVMEGLRHFKVIQ